MFEVAKTLYPSKSFVHSAFLRLDFSTKHHFFSASVSAKIYFHGSESHRSQGEIRGFLIKVLNTEKSFCNLALLQPLWGDDGDSTSKCAHQFGRSS